MIPRVLLDEIKRWVVQWHNSIGHAPPHAPPSDTVNEQTTKGQASSGGVSEEYSRGDHTHGTPQ